MASQAPGHRDSLLHGQRQDHLVLYPQPPIMQLQDLVPSPLAPFHPGVCFHHKVLWDHQQVNLPDQDTEMQHSGLQARPARQLKALPGSDLGHRCHHQLGGTSDQQDSPNPAPQALHIPAAACPYDLLQTSPALDLRETGHHPLATHVRA